MDQQTPSNQTQPTSTNAPVPAQKRPIRVMVIDDSPTVRKIIETSLGRETCRVAEEQILMVTEYHKLWVAICYNTQDGGIQDYTMKFDSEGNPYCPEAEDFSGQYHASFSIRGETGDSPLILNDA